MKLLVCIGGEVFSTATVRLAVEFAARLQADLSILYVGSPITQFHQKEVQLAKEKLAQWMIETPEMKVLNSALDILREMNFLKLDNQGQLNIRHGFKPEISGAFEFHLYGSLGQNVRFRYREGEIVDNIRKETEQVHYDLVFVGASQKRRLVHRILQFVPSNTMMIKKGATHPEKFLLCVKRSKSSRSAAWFTIQIAQLLSMPIEILATTRFPAKVARLKVMTDRYMKVCERYQIPSSSYVRVGGLEDAVMQVATPLHLVVMGPSRVNELMQYFFGSLPVKISQKVNASILLVKEERKEELKNLLQRPA
ncbi:MAG TPA: universal stress protein [Acidobacteriota bacterium]|jgi:nucleotide-binding universal stress UspA family protein